MLKPLPEQLVATPEELVHCCEHLAACRRFGFDTEFVGEESYHPRLCLIQAATEEKLFLIDPQTVGELDRFWRLIVDPANLIVVHAGREDVRLCHLWCGDTPGNLFDLQIAAGLTGYRYPVSHGHLVQQVLGVRIGKGETLTEWRNRPLTPEQIRYAFDDVRYLLPLWERLSTTLEQLDRYSWAREEFQRVKVAAAPSSEQMASSDKWRKLRGLGTLDRRRLAIAREVFRWREEMAAKSNRPARTIVRDDLVVEIARRNPTRSRELRVLRGMPKRFIDVVLRSVHRANNLPLAKCPEIPDQEQDPPQLAVVAHILSAVLGHICAKERIAPGLTATNQELKQLVRCHRRGRSLPEDFLLAQGWRAAHVLPQLQAALEGRAAVYVADIQSPAPLEFMEHPVRESNSD